ncbi:uncharacterized protein BDV14DRAFT_76279 [Aspergillus stella-maris]|uniref:uncharacterized protein n=1 Tax=Aspergillus stella-maris TaxID=1810926 RepID=UPI003CCCED77
MPRTYGKSKAKAKQTRLSFVPSQFASDGQDEEHSRDSRNANVRYTHPSLGTLKRDRSESKKSAEPKPFVTRRSESSVEEASQSQSHSEAQSASEESERKRKKKKEKKSKKDKKSSSQKSKSNTPVAPPTPPPATQDSESDSDVEIVHSARKKSRDTNGKRKRVDSSEPEEQQISDESDADEIIQSARKRTRDRSAKRKRVDSSEPEEQQVSDEGDADEVVARPRRKLRRGGAPQPIVVDDDEDSEEEGDRAATSKSPSVPVTPRRDSVQDRLDIEEDLEDLQDSVVKASRTRGNVANSARAQRQRHLEALRRRRAGQKSEDDEEDALSPHPEATGSDDEEEAEDKETEAPPRQPQFRNWANESSSSDVESTIGANEDLDRYEDDFVLEDEDDKLGAPSGLDDIPIEFSRHAYKQLKDYFADAVEWMVHNQLNPAFPRSDPVYRVAFDKLETEVRGRAGSQLVSSVWNTDFKRALLARPTIEVSAYPTEHCHPCDACNRSGHPASYDVKLSGKAYSLDTLEALSDADSDDDEQSDSNEENDEQERDRDGYVLPPEYKHFYLGRHCMKNADMAHTLTHWRYHLNEWVVEHLRIKGQFSDEKVLKRSGYSQKKKNKSAARAYNKMVESQEVKKLWRDFHNHLRVARESAV